MRSVKRQVNAVEFSTASRCCSRQVKHSVEQNRRMIGLWHLADESRPHRIVEFPDDGHNVSPPLVFLDAWRQSRVFQTLADCLAVRQLRRYRCDPVGETLAFSDYASERPSIRRQALICPKCIET